MAAKRGTDRREERFLSAQAGRLAGARREEKAPACFARNDGGGGRIGPASMTASFGGKQGFLCLGESAEERLEDGGAGEA